MKPTEEQAAAVSTFTAGQDIVLEAGAGTGKTSTLKLLAAAKPGARGMYLAYNRAIADEAKRSFPSSVRCGTAHSYAFAAVGRTYAHRLRGARMPAWRAAKALGIHGPERFGERLLNPDTLARLTMQTVSNFCRSADPAPAAHHAPIVEGLDAADGPRRGPNNRALAGLLARLAGTAWADLRRTDGQLRFTHDHYLKLWQLSEPRLEVDYILFDEAQDANPVIDAVVRAQTHAQRVMVGDRAQAIYGWNGAVDAMANFNGTRLYLSQSWRFGQAIAEEANRYLAELDTGLRLTGNPAIRSTVEEWPAATAVLCRTNAGAMTATLDLQRAGVPVHLVGGANDVAAFVRAAEELQNTGGTSHPDLLAFTTWGQVQDYVEQDPDGSDLAVMVRMIEQYGTDVILGALDAAVSEEDAQVTVSTAHKSKGREWGSVRIAGDFTPRQRDGELVPPTPEETMLRYVAVTRAMRILDPGPLARPSAAPSAPQPAAEPAPAVAVPAAGPSPLSAAEAALADLVMAPSLRVATLAG